MGRAKKAPPSMVKLGGTDSWCTSQPVYDGLLELYDGQIDTDPCTNKHAIIRAVTMYYKAGTFLPWRRRTYENPPFSKTAIFTAHGLDELHNGNCTELVRLTMFAPSTAWWLEMCGIEVPGLTHSRMRDRWKPARRPNPHIIATKRLTFIGDRSDTARFDTALTYFGNRPQKFYKAFRHLTRWTARGRV